MFLNDQIRSLSQQLLKVADEEEAAQVALQLRAALHEHLETVRGTLLLSVPQESPTKSA